MFEFFKEFDESIYKEIIEEVETNMWNNRSISIIQSEIEKIVKKLFNDSGIIITNIDNNGIEFREYNPTLSRLLDKENKFIEYLNRNNILSHKDIDNYWVIHNTANFKKHGAKNNNVVDINNELKEKSLKFLFKLCCNAYRFKFKKLPKSLWDEKYFKSLLVKPKNQVRESIVNSEGRDFDNTELDTIKKEYELLKNKFEVIEKNSYKHPRDVENKNKLDIGNSCLKNKDFENAKIAFKNCKNLDITNLEAYVGLILCDYKKCSIDELADFFAKSPSNNTLKENLNYKNLKQFCCNKMTENFDKNFEAKLYYSRYIKPYNKAIDFFENKDYKKALQIFQSIYEFNDSSIKSEEIITKLEINIKNLLKQELFDSAIQEYKNIINLLSAEDLKLYINKQIENIIQEKKYREENLELRDTELDKELFKYSSNLNLVKNIKINKSVCFIKKDFFSLFPSLENLIFTGDGPISIEENNFSSFKKLNFNIKNGYKYLGSKQNPYMILVEAKNFKAENLASTTKFLMDESVISDTLSELLMPRSVDVTCKDAFKLAPNITKVIVNHDMRELNGFQNQNNLKKLEINYATSIGDYAFWKCPQLKEIKFFQGRWNLGKHSFAECVGLEKVEFNHDSYVKISESAFSQCVNLKKVILPKREETFSKENLNKLCIEKYAFAWCKKLSFIDISANYALFLPEACFIGCENLEKVVLNEVLAQGVSNYVFAGCKKLREINLTDRISYIGRNAFENCSNLNISLNLKNIETLDSRAFKNSGIEELIISSTALKNLSCSAFENCKNLKKVTLPNRIAIDEKAFKNCINLRSVIFKKLNDSKDYENLETNIINIDCFYGCRYLNELILPLETTYIYIKSDRLDENEIKFNFLKIPKNTKVHFLIKEFLDNNFNKIEEEFYFNYVRRKK